MAFSNQMTYLKQAGYDTISLYQLEAYLKNQINLPGKAIVLTFDDGLKSVYRYAYPVLKDYGFRATAFIISSRIKRHPQKWNPDSLQFMSVSELKQIQDVFDVQSHTHFLHRTDGNRQPILLSRSLHNIEFDFERSRARCRSSTRTCCICPTRSAAITSGRSRRRRMPVSIWR